MAGNWPVGLPPGTGLREARLATLTWCLAQDSYAFLVYEGKTFVFALVLHTCKSSSTHVWGWQQEKGDCSSLKGAAAIQMQPPPFL